MQISRNVGGNSLHLSAKIFIKSRMIAKELQNMERLTVEKFNQAGSEDEFYLSYDRAGDWPVAVDSPFSIEGIMIVLCHCGHSRVTIDGKSHLLSEGNVVILPEKHIISIARNTEPMTESILFVSTDFILDMPSPIDTDIFVYSRFAPVISVSKERMEDYRSYFRFIEKERRENGKYRKHIIRSLIYALFLELTAEFEQHYEVGSDCKIKDESLSDAFFRLLAANFREHRSVSWYAGQLNLTPKYLSGVVKEHTGRTILDWIHESVMIEAKMLLLSSEMTVQEISDHLNFSSSSAFVQFYRKHSGVTPGSEKR